MTIAINITISKHHCHRHHHNFEDRHDHCQQPSFLSVTIVHASCTAISMNAPSPLPGIKSADLFILAVTRKSG
jgi:hypothetical protein